MNEALTDAIQHMFLDVRQGFWQQTRNGMGKFIRG